MLAIIILFILTLTLMLIIKFVVTPRYGIDVQERFIERINYIPSETGKLNSKMLGRWLEDGEQRKAIDGYVFPVLFPLDLLFLVCLGLLAGFASVGLASRIDFLANVPGWIWWFFPVFYAVSDTAEDITIAAIFKLFIPLTERSFKLLRALTTIKLATVSTAIGQVGFLAALNTLLFFFPPSRSF